MPPVLADSAGTGEGDRCRVTFLGHSSTLVAMNGLNILTDPNLSRHIFFIIRRRSGPPVRVRDLPPIALVLISHGHYDHLDLSTLRELRRDTPVIVPPGLDRILRWAGMKQIIILGPGETYHMKDVAVTAVPARHFPGRPPFFPHTGYQGYVIYCPHPLGDFQTVARALPRAHSTSYESSRNGEHVVQDKNPRARPVSFHKQQRRR